MDNVEQFITEARAESKSVVMLAPGGGAYKRASIRGDYCPQMVIDSLLSQNDIAVIALGRHDCEVNRARPWALMIPYLKLDYSNIFSKADIVIHHGEYSILRMML